GAGGRGRQRGAVRQPRPQPGIALRPQHRHRRPQPGGGVGMNLRRLMQLGLKSFRARRASVLLSIAAILISVLLFTGVQYLRGQVERWFVQTISGTDLVVGARSGPVNLLLYSVFRIGNASNNIDWHSYEF